MSSLLRSKKGQFFIASAVVIVAAISAVFFFLVQFNQVENPTLIVRDDLYFAEGLNEEYSKIAELALSNFSREGASDAGYLTSSIDNFTDLVVNLSNQKRTSLSVSTSTNTVNTEQVNFTVNATLLSEGRQIELDFNAVSAVNASIDSVSSTSPCTFDFYVYKEYQEGILGLDSSHLTASVNGTDCSATFQEEGSGLYNATCSGQSCSGSTVGINVTDTRNVFGEDSYSV